MFTNTKAFSGFSVHDLAQAEHFYSEALGLKVTRNPDMPILTLHITGGNPVIVYLKPNHQPATFTILNFPVSNVQQAVQALKLKGVVFESYSGPEIETGPDHVFRGGGPLIAWFKDPSGNILSVIEAD